MDVTKSNERFFESKVIHYYYLLLYADLLFLFNGMISHRKDIWSYFATGLNYHENTMHHSQYTNNHVTITSIEVERCLFRLPCITQFIWAQMKVVTISWLWKKEKNYWWDTKNTLNAILWLLSLQKNIE